MYGFSISSTSVVMVSCTNTSGDMSVQASFIFSARCCWISVMAIFSQTGSTPMRACSTTVCRRVKMSVIGAPANEIFTVRASHDLRVFHVQFHPCLFAQPGHGRIEPPAAVRVRSAISICCSRVAKYASGAYSVPPIARHVPM